jgi:hypothetical protein
VGPDLDLSGRITPRDQSLWQAAFARGARSSVPPAVRLNVGAVGAASSAPAPVPGLKQQVIDTPRAPGTPDADGLLRESDFAGVGEAPQAIETAKRPVSMQDVSPR